MCSLKSLPFSAAAWLLLFLFMPTATARQGWALQLLALLLLPLALGLTTEPLKAGMGLLTFMTGFELFYNNLEQSVAMIIFLALANLTLALTISYLTQTRHALPEFFRQRS